MRKATNAWAILNRHPLGSEVAQQSVAPGLLKTDSRDHQPTFSHFSAWSADPASPYRDGSAPEG